MLDEAAERASVVAEARKWLGTPFCHGQQLIGVGVDCAQLLIAVYGAVGLVPQPAVDHYSQDWFLHEKAPDRLQEVISRYCVRTRPPKPGDIAVFRFGRAVAHAGIVTEFPSMIHAEKTQGKVVEDRCGENDAFGARLVGWWTLTRWANGGAE